MWILIADGSVVYRNVFKKAVAAFDKSAAVDFAENCQQALKKTRQHDYDVIIIDVELPDNGALPAFISAVSSQLPDALIAITTRPSPMNARLVEASMAARSVKLCIPKPLDDDYNSNIEAIKHKIADVYDLLRERHERRKPRPGRPENPAAASAAYAPDIVMVASSTGGPAALETIVQGIDKNIPVPIIIVQHMPPRFLDNFRTQLQAKTKLRVEITEDGEEIKPGTIYLARGGVHTKLNRHRCVSLDSSPPVNGVRPSADVLFSSVAESFPDSARVLAVILTGMGSDGCKGIEKLKENLSCYCIAESEETCVVYGMPRAVAERGLADAVLDLGKIASAVNEKAWREVI